LPATLLADLPSKHFAGPLCRCGASRPNWRNGISAVVVPAQAIVAHHLASFQQFSPRQRPGSFTVEQAMEKLRNPPSSN
jgi:hypothetical protein